MDIIRNYALCLKPLQNSKATNTGMFLFDCTVDSVGITNNSLSSAKIYSLIVAEFSQLASNLSLEVALTICTHTLTES